MTLYNRNYNNQNDVQKEAQKLNPQERREKIVKMINNNNNLTINEMSKALGVSKPTIERDLAQLRKENTVEYIGPAKTGFWKVKK